MDKTGPFDEYVDRIRRFFDFYRQDNVKIHPEDQEVLAKASSEFERLLQEGAIDSSNRYPLLDDKRVFPDFHTFLDFSALQKSISRSAEDLMEDEGIDRGLSFILTTRCHHSCVHCQDDLSPEGLDIDFGLLTSIDDKFWNAFSFVHMSNESDALAYPYDLFEVVKLLSERGIKKMSFDIRAFKDDKSGETFERILKYGQKEGIHTKVRISFDFYAPDVYANPLNPNLEKRFMEVLSLSLPLADEITVNVNGSFKYSRSHIFKTQRFLNDILHRNGFATPFRVGYILADDPEAEIDRLSQQKNESGFSEFELMEMIGFCNPCKNFVPYYEHEGTGKRIDVKYGPTLNMGRWKKVKDKGLIQNPYDRFVPRNERGAHICGVNLSSRFTLYPGGEISACNGGYARRVCFANINEGYDNFVEQYQQVLKSLNQFYQQKLGQIMQGKQNTWLCEMPDLYDKIFEFKG